MSFMHDIGDIDFPEDWTQHTIEEVAHFSRGLSWAKRDETDKDNGNLVVSIPNVRDGHIDFESKFNHYLGCPIPEAKRLRVGDIVFVGSSGSLQNVGRNAKVRELPTPVVAFASFTFKATPDREVIDPDFFYHLVNSDLVPFEDYCSRAADGKFNFQLVDFKSKQQLRLPGKEEQQRIAQVLSTVQEAIAQQERLIRTTTELKQALMQKLFTEGLRGEALKETEIGLVPESWEVVKLEDLADVRSGKRLPMGNALVAEDTGYPYIRVTDFEDNTVLTEQLLFVPTHIQPRIQRYIIEKDDVYISVAGSIGIVGMIPEELDGANLTENANRLVIRNKKRIEPRYLMYWLDSDRCQHEIKAQTLKNAQPKLALGRIKTLAVALPSIEEQKDMVRALDAVRTKRQVAELKTKTLQDLFRTLLHELMTGKVRVGEEVMDYTPVHT